MYKILLVDDEEMVIKSLRATVDWKSYGFEIIDYALSAEEALEKVELQKPDIVITDIKMPRVNGLELLHMIKKINPHIKCLVISGYAEFAYIQKAVRLEVVGYCLKPFDEEEIALYLKRIRKMLDHKTEEADVTNCILEYIQSNTAEALNYMIPVYQMKGIDFEREKICAVYMIGVEGEKADQIPYQLLVHSGLQKYIGFIDEKDITSIKELFIKDGECSGRAGISQPISSPDKVARAIREAKCCAYQSFCSKNCEPITCDSHVTYDFSAIQSLERALENTDTTKVHRSLEEISQKFEDGSYNMNYAMKLQSVYTSWITNYIKSEEVELIFEYENLCEMYSDVYEQLKQIESAYTEANNSDEFMNKISNKTFFTIYQYVENNYTRQINVTDLANRFHINACYFSQLFRKEIGSTFSDYLAKKRIDHACNLLLETELKVNEIAEMSGFNDYFYFCRVFRKLKNCSPTEYRATA